MPPEPEFPEAARVGDEPLNETLSHAVTAKQAEQRSAERADGSGRSRRLIKGAAIGIGSAAVVAALIYARKSYYSSGDDD